MLLNLNLGVSSVLIGLGIVISTGFAISLFLSGKKKKVAASNVLCTLTDPEKSIQLPLMEKMVINHDTRKYRFKLPSDKHVLGLPIGQHLYISAKIGDEIVRRAYTPISSDEDFGYVDLIIKVYFKDIHPKFPEGGKLSQYIDDLKIGDTIDIKGPSGRLEYVGCGTFKIKNSKRDTASRTVTVKYISMIAGGTGITPMLQLIRHITNNAEDDTKISLLFANQTIKDILMQDELEKLATLFPNKFKLWYTVDVADNDWNYSIGFVSMDMIEKHLFPPSNDNIILMCGPPPMIKYACIPNLNELNYSESLRFAY